MFEESTSASGRDRIGDWVLRAGVALAFILFGLDKFPSGPGAQWVRFFDQVGIGQWFRYFTGIVEIGAAVLVLFPSTTRFGIATLAATMAVASLIHILIIHQPANAIITGAFCIGLIAFWLRMRNK
jgi:putative oxidoreductase